MSAYAGAVIFRLMRTRPGMVARKSGRGPVGLFVGLSTLDVIHYVDELPAINQKITAHGQEVAAGGPATNAAVTFAALGGEAVLVTALGTGAASDIIRSDLDACGVQVVDAAPDQHDRTPISSITVLRDTGERSVVSVDARVDLIVAAPDLSGLVAGADVVLVDGHHPTLAEEASRCARASATPLVLDAGRWKPVMSRLIPRADAVICSADFRFPAATDLHSSARAVRAQGVATVVVTRGPDAVLWWQDGQSGSVTPPSRLPVKDTSGAGDVFHGAYCYLSTQPRFSDLAARLAIASRVASLKCSYAGTRSWLGHLSAEIATAALLTNEGERQHPSGDLPHRLRTPR